MALALLLAGGVAQAIINGQPDTGPKAHPYVGAYVAKVKGQRVAVCSGTLISPRVFLTAGHCTDSVMKEHSPTYVSLDPTYKPGSSEVISATPYTHPKSFCSPEVRKKTCPPDFHLADVAYDVGVAVLDKPVRMATYGALPEEGLVDTLKEGQRLTVVGYGVSDFDITGERNRAMVSPLPIDPALGDQLVKTSGVNIVGGGEGPCSGDSGGPLFAADQETIVGVTSVTHLLCRGPDYYQRMDLPRVLSWIRSFP